MTPPNEAAELKAAYESLTAVIQTILDLKKWTDEGRMLLTDYVVFAVQQGFDAHGGGRSGTIYLFRDGDLPWHSAIGAARAGTLRLEKDFNRDDPDDDWLS